MSEGTIIMLFPSIKIMFLNFRCVMKMDHHCPWINNCVGHKNHKSFTLFLTFVVIGCTHAAVLITCCCLQHLFWVSNLSLDLAEIIDSNKQTNCLIFAFMLAGLIQINNGIDNIIQFYQIDIHPVSIVLKPI